MLLTFLHKYFVTLNDNETLFQQHFDILFSKNLFETLKLDILLTFNVLSMDIKSLLNIYFDADILTSFTHVQAAIGSDRVGVIFTP